MVEMTQETRMYIELGCMFFVMMFCLVVSWIVNVYFKRNDLNETFNASNHADLIIDFEKGENNLNNK